MCSDLFYINTTDFTTIVYPFLFCIIGGCIGLLGISISGVSIIITLFPTEDVAIINQLQKGAFEEILNDFKFLAFHISIGVIFISLLIWIGFIKVSYGFALWITYIAMFLIIYFIIFTLLYCSTLVRNCVHLSSIKQTIASIKKLKRTLLEEKNELVSDYIVAILAKMHGFSTNEFYEDLIHSIQENELPDKDELILYIKKRYDIE